MGRSLSGRRRAVRLALVALVVGLVVDLSRAPERQLTARVELGALSLYRQRVSPWLGAAGVRCRFRPTCSRYAEGVIRKRGALVGTALAAWRVARCGPWTAAGTVDPP